MVYIIREKGPTRPVVSAEIGNFFGYCILPFGIYSQEIKCPSQSMARGLMSGAVGQYCSPLPVTRFGYEVDLHNKDP
jgi:hypothetical protein